MIPKFRIKKNKDGKYECYYVHKYSFWGKEILKPYITYAGLDEVYPFSSLNSLVNELKMEVIKNTEQI